MADTESNKRKEKYLESKTKNYQPRRKTREVDRTFHEW